MAISTIEWTEKTWNPTTGCDKISAGCKFCYAEIMALRLKAMGQKKYKNGFDLTLHEHELETPYKWKKPSMIFVDSMSDLFHKDIPLEFIQKVFKVMNDTPQHTYQVLTKRADILYKYHSQLNWTDNIWVGVSVEDEKQLGRIDYLRKTDATLKWVSFEPLINEISSSNLEDINWAVVGGESGREYRPCKIEWIEKIIEQCKEQNVSVFVKQIGTHYAKLNKLKSFKGGDISEFPASLQIRQFPKTKTKNK